MKTTTFLTLACGAALALSACSAPETGPTGGGPIDPKAGGPEAHADGILWVASKSTLGTGRKPALTTYDLATGNKRRNADLTRDPQALVLTDKYAFAVCEEGLLVRVRRSDMAVDSAVLKRKSSAQRPRYHLAADGNAVWLGNVDEGFIHIDPETLAEAGRMTFTNPAGSTVDGLALAGGAPWALIGGSNFRLIRIDADALKPSATLGLGRNPADPDGPRAAGRNGYGTLGVSGNRALVYAYTDKRLIRVDLANAAVGESWNADWIRHESLRVNGTLSIHGYEGGFLVASSDSLWIRRVGMEGKTHAQKATKHHVDRSAARADGLLGLTYASGGAIGEVALVRGAALDTVRSLEFTWEQAALAFE